MIICVTGAPGSGKTTLAKALAAILDYKHVSTGDIARALADVDPEVRSALENGKFAPPEKMDDAVIETLAVYTNIVIDGYPRYPAQMDRSHKEFAPFCLFLSANPSRCLARLQTRGRDYDLRLEMKRMNNYLTETAPLMMRILDGTVRGSLVDADRCLEKTLVQARSAVQLEIYRRQR